jgi:ketosteroid isomerase-like protein
MRKGGAMAHPNEELVRKGFEAFAKGDVDTLRALFDPDAVWHAPGRSPLSGDHRGVDDILDFFARTMELTAGTFRVELHDVVANDEHAVAMYVARGEREGKTLEDKSVLVSHVRNGTFTETWQYSEDQYAVDEFIS